MENYFEILMKCPLFQQIEQEELIGMMKCLDARLLKVASKEWIFMEGDPAKHVGVVLSGAVQIIKEDFYGNRSILARMESSELFGESLACAGVGKMPVSVLAETDCEILLVDVKRILSTCSNACMFHRQLIDNLLKVISSKNLMLNQKIEIISQKTTKEKLMTYLNLLAKQQNSNSFYVPYDRQELADFLGVERSAMSAEISKLKKDGIIDSKKNYFEILQSP